MIKTVLALALSLCCVESFQLRMSSSVLVAGLNPALQRQVTFAHGLTKGSVNRASGAGVGIGGKGQNMLVASTFMGVREDVKVDIAQFVGTGGEGDSLIELLRGIHTRESLTMRSKTPLRICTTLVDATCGNETTELIEPSGNVAEAEAEEMLKKISDNYVEDAPVGIALMGTMPPGLPKDYYMQILMAAGMKAGHTKVLMDTSIKVPDSLALCAQAGVQGMVKLNARELTGMMGVQEGVGIGDKADSATSNQVVLAACTALAQSVSSLVEGCSIEGDSCPSGFIGVTDGPYQAHLVEFDPAGGSIKAHTLYTIPSLHKPLASAIGAGDAVASGTLMAWSGCFKEEGDKEGATTVVDAFKFGLAVGAASCLTTGNSVWEKADCDALLANIQVEPHHWPCREDH